MISILVYGRNDTYGYNLHKRAAISLNTIAAQLDDDNDELIFVDYNTPDDFPTFPEAIADTLTPHARARLRVLRARPALHQQIAGQHTMPLIEPVCRNIGALRSNSANRWLLSTNTDIILSMRGPEEFGALLSSLESGFYQTPRVEVPETIWEGLDRRDPDRILAELRRLAPALYLDEIVYGSPRILYDGPGDFQLMERASLFAIDGFDERMDRGWHVDANLAVRMALYCGHITGLEDRIFAYHCDHTRQLTQAHSANRQENDASIFVDTISDATLPTQRGNWGAPDFPIEEIRLSDDSASIYTRALIKANGTAQLSPMRATYASDTYNRVDYDPRHVMPFLVDLVSSESRDLCLGWVGFRSETLERFAIAWRELGFSTLIRVLGAEPPPTSATMTSDQTTMLAECNLFVFDFGDPMPGKPFTRKEQGALAGLLFALRMEEGPRLSMGRPPRRVVGINVLHNRYERSFAISVDAAATPFSTRIRHGFVRPSVRRINWLSIAESISNPCLTLAASTSGLDEGSHDLHLCILRDIAANKGTALLEIGVAGQQILAWRGSVASLDRHMREVSFDIDSPDDVVAINIEIHDAGDTHLTELWSAPAGTPPSGTQLGVDMLGSERNWLPHCSVGSAGERNAVGVASISGCRGHVIYGPYWSLLPGSYRCEIEIMGGSTFWRKAIKEKRAPIFVEVQTSAGDLLKRKYIFPRKSTRRFWIDFVVQEWSLGFPLEVRVYSCGASQFTVSHIYVDKI